MSKLSLVFVCFLLVLVAVQNSAGQDEEELRKKLLNFNFHFIFIFETFCNFKTFINKLLTVYFIGSIFIVMKYFLKL